jgi:hypothetical protein
MNCTYLLPFRRRVFDPAEAERLQSYFESIRTVLPEIIVIDGSPPDVFAAHDEIWSRTCRHERVDRRFGFLNDKVNGIQTGVRLAGNEKIILADDDIRYSSADIEQIAKLLDDFEVVRPQNCFAFHGRDAHATFPARMEATRMLINRATLRAADYPGTSAFRRSIFLRAGDYDGDVLFDNEELIRHFAHIGATIFYANNFFIEKRPPNFRKWLEQRPRQAYEDFSLRAKTLLFALLPVVLIVTGLIFGIRAELTCVSGILVGAFTLALLGRARGAARHSFPLHVCLFAPLWIIECSLSTYWAFYWFLHRGGYPFGDRLLSKGVGRDWVEGGKIAARQWTSCKRRNLLPLDRLVTRPVQAGNL